MAFIQGTGVKETDALMVVLVFTSLSFELYAVLVVVVKGLAIVAVERLYTLLTWKLYNL